MKPRYDPRVFLALTVSPGNKQRLSATQELFRPLLPRWHFIPMENFHVTLRFLGEIPEEQIAQIDSACQRLAPGLVPFTLNWNCIDFFGSPKSARVLFAAAETNEALSRLVRELEVIPPAAERERREFTPHITLAKARSQMDPAASRTSTAILSKLREQGKVGNHTLDFSMTSVHLDFVMMETIWVGRGVEYALRSRYPFARVEGGLVG